VKVCVSIHTDSGDFSHTFGIVGRQFPDSERLATAIAKRVQSALGTADLRVFSKLGTTDYSTYIFATHAKVPAALIELCSHELPRDLDALWANGQQVAQALVDGVIEYAGRCNDVDWRAEAEAYRVKYEQATAEVATAKTRIQWLESYLKNIGALAGQALQKG